MRIIGGKWRSRRIEFPSDPGTRPMPDRMREAVFDILASRFGCPGGLPPIDVVDLFAGSGSLGLEAISRGAAACDFVERRKPALAVLRRNLVQLESGATCRIVAGNAWTVSLNTPRPTGAYSLIFADPPYRDARDASRTGRVGRLLADLYRAGWADDDTTIALHHEARVIYVPDDGAWWRVSDHRLYGSSGLTLITGRGGEHGGEEAVDSDQAD